MAGPRGAEPTVHGSFTAQQLAECQRMIASISWTNEPDTRIADMVEPGHGTTDGLNSKRAVVGRQPQ